jgi:hypothetical protein
VSGRSKTSLRQLNLNPPAETGGLFFERGSRGGVAGVFSNWLWTPKNAKQSGKALLMDNVRHSARNWWAPASCKIEYFLAAKSSIIPS